MACVSTCLPINKQCDIPTGFASAWYTQILSEIAYSWHSILKAESDVVLEVYNTKGQRVKKLVNTRQTKGEQITLWDGKDEAGRECSTGIYLIKCSEGNSHRETGKVTLIKH